MKYKVLGSLLIFIGLIGVAFGISFFSLASELPEGSPTPPKKDIIVVTGRYVSDNGNSITLYEGSTLSLNDGQPIPYKLKIWYDMPFTDEKTGQITLLDLCYLNADLKGDATYSTRIQYDYTDVSLIFETTIYQLENQNK